MSTITLQRVVECSAQNHVTIVVTGDVTHTYRSTMEELLAPMNDEERDAFVKGIIRFAKLTRSAEQVRTALASGVAVTI